MDYIRFFFNPFQPTHPIMVASPKMLRIALLAGGDPAFGR